MFLLSKWNQTKTYEYDIVRDFGTDYGICCWYTPQLNYTEIDIHTKELKYQQLRQDKVLPLIQSYEEYHIYFIYPLEHPCRLVP